MNATPRSYHLNQKEAALAFRQVADHCQSLKNWIATNVENEKFDRAAELVKELREYQNLYSKLNVEAHKVIDAA